MLTQSTGQPMFKKPGKEWISKLVYLMDEQFRVPGTNFRFGFDPLLNLFPVVGDLTGFLISAGLLMALAKRGAGNKLVVLMSINIFLDVLIGGIPLIGQIFDFYFKANSRNLRLMKEYYVEGRHQGSGKNTIVLALCIMALILVLLIILLWKVTEWFIHLF
jgi:hypothetical protein